MKQITITDDKENITTELFGEWSYGEIIYTLTMALRTMTDEAMGISNDHVESRVGDTPATDR